MYVDDGVIFACGPTWDAVDSLLQEEYRVCDLWLRQNNLSAEPAKTELLYFRTLRAHLEPLLDWLFLPDSMTCRYYWVTPAPTVRYLGFFLNQRLDWKLSLGVPQDVAGAWEHPLQAVYGKLAAGL